MAASRLRLLLLCVTLSACAHAVEAPSPAPAAAQPQAEIVWPRPPAGGRARHVGSVTQARPAKPERWWMRALRAIAGAPPAQKIPDALVRPFDAAMRGDGSFVVADADRPGVLEYARDGSFAAELTCASHAWSAPMSVALADDGAVWVADAAAGAVVRWTARECRVLRPEGLERPTGLAWSRGRVVVADPPAHRVVLLSEDGRVEARMGERGDAEGQLNFPTDVSAAADGSFFVVDALNFRIVHLGADGGWLGAFGAPGEQDAGLARPKGVDVDAASGLVYVSDAQRDVVLVFRPDGVLEYVLGESGADPGQLAHPAGVSIAGGRLVVANSVNRRAEIFELLGEHR